jgi:hypothetical protein
MMRYAILACFSGPFFPVLDYLSIFLVSRSARGGAWVLEFHFGYWFALGGSSIFPCAPPFHVPHWTFSSNAVWFMD